MLEDEPRDSIGQGPDLGSQYSCLVTMRVSCLIVYSKDFWCFIEYVNFTKDVEAIFLLNLKNTVCITKGLNELRHCLQPNENLFSKNLARASSICSIKP